MPPSESEGLTDAKGLHFLYNPRVEAAPLPEAFVRQCAWCERLLDDSGNATGEPLPELAERAELNRTYGICATCAADLMAKFEKLPRPD